MIADAPRALPDNNNYTHSEIEVEIRMVVPKHFFVCTPAQIVPSPIQLKECCDGEQPKDPHRGRVAIEHVRSHAKVEQERSIKMFVAHELPETRWVIVRVIVRPSPQNDQEANQVKRNPVRHDP